MNITMNYGDGYDYANDDCADDGDGDESDCILVMLALVFKGYFPACIA